MQPRDFLEAIEAAQTPRADWRDRRAWNLHSGRRRADDDPECAASRLCALESDVSRGVHGRAGLSLEQRAVVFASGSPFAPVTYEGREVLSGQGNNAYVFPGIGLGAIVCRPRPIPDEVFLAAAHTLAELVTAQDLETGSLYPPLRDIRRISLAIALSVANTAYEMKLARAKRPRNIRQVIERFMYEP